VRNVVSLPTLVCALHLVGIIVNRPWD
jgi:hypothetical protein